jgi:hypothetical protein
MIPNEEVLKRYRGWKARQENARLRQARMKNRLEINAIRRAHYDKLANPQPQKKPVVEEKTDDEGNEVVEVNFDDMTNADLKAALEAKGFEVPKNTARVRLIELYKEHVGV